MDKSKLIDAFKCISIPLEKKTQLIDSIQNSIKEEIQNSNSNDLYYTIIFNTDKHTIRVESKNINLVLADNVNYNFDSDFGKYVIQCTVDKQTYNKLRQNKCIMYVVESESDEEEDKLTETYYKVANKTKDTNRFVLNIGDSTNAAIVIKY